jgi:hypothetical protein
MDRSEVKRIADKEARKEVKGHEKRMHKMAKGGVTGESMRKHGRNMARAMNQRGG